MAKQRKSPLSAGAINCIFGRRLIRQDGSFDRSAIVTFARRWAATEGVSFGHAQKHAWEVARGQLQKARNYDATRRTAAAQIEWRMAA
jgi:hypothetical protein